MRFILMLAVALLLLAPATAGTATALNDIYAQATGAPSEQSTAKKPKRKRAPKVQYMRAVPYR